MHLQKTLLELSLLGLLVGGMVLLWHQVPLPCRQPLLYSLGTFDTRFGISREDFLKEAAAASQLWSAAMGKELLRYDPAATFHVNLVYDARQERTVEGQALDSSLADTKRKATLLDQKQENLVSQYHQLATQYQQDIQDYHTEATTYNAAVQNWNQQGGAPPKEYQRLQDESQSLIEQGKKLEAERQTVNQLASKINASSRDQVALVEGYNTQVEQFLNRYGVPEQFDQGIYDGKEITIYQYDDLPHLRAVLAHEFGHALGLEHDNDPQSIMYPLMKDQSVQPLVLTSEDKSLLLKQCQRSWWDIVLERVNLLREKFSSPTTQNI